MSQSLSPNSWHGSEGPLFTVGSLRVDLTLLLIGIHTLAMAVAAVLAASGLGDWVNQAAFAAGDLRAGQIWTRVHICPARRSPAAKAAWLTQSPSPEAARTAATAIASV